MVRVWTCQTFIYKIDNAEHLSLSITTTMDRDTNASSLPLNISLMIIDMFGKDPDEVPVMYKSWGACALTCRVGCALPY